MLNRKFLLYTLSILMGSIILLSSACASNGAAAAAVGADQTTDNIVESTDTIEAVPVTETPAPTQTPLSTATPDTRMKPEDWQNWPIIPEVTKKSREIYTLGKELGVNPNAFSKIGDCQNIKESFMGLYDLKRYYLAPEQADWQETIDNFSGFFNRDGKAIGTGAERGSGAVPTAGRS